MIKVIGVLGGRNGYETKTAANYVQELQATIARHTKGYFTVEEAAQTLAENYPGEVEAKPMIQQMLKALHDGKLTIRNIGDKFPLLNKHDVRSYIHLVRAGEVNKWLQDDGHDYRLPATPAPVMADGPAKPRSNKSEKTLIFEAKVLELMGKFWNERTPGTKPKKGELCKLVYAELLRGSIRGERALTDGMVRDAAKPWKAPLVLPAFVPDSKFNDRRHPFKGDK